MRSKFLFLILLFAASATATPLAQKFNFDGVLTDNVGTPITAPTTVRFTVYNPSQTCILMEEDKAVTPDSNGNFSVQIGGGGATVNDPGKTFAQIFQNNTIITGLVCGSYAPASGDGRLIRVTIDPLVTPSVLTPDFEMNSVPMANVAETIQGLTPTDLLQTGTGNLTQADVQNVFSAANYGELTALLAGTSTKYATESANEGTTLPSYTTGSPPAIPVVGSIWYDSTANVVKFYNGSIQTLSTGAAGTVTSVATGTGLTGGPITGAGTISLDNTAVTPGTYSGLTIDAQGRVTNAAILAIGDLPASVLRAGGQSGAVTVGSSDNTVTLLSNGASALHVTAPGGLVGIGTLTPGARLDIASTDAVIVPRGTTGEQPGTPVDGMIRYNTTNFRFEARENGTWKDMIASGGTLGGLTAGRIPYASGANALTDSANLFWDNGGSRLGIGTSTPQDTLHVHKNAGSSNFVQISNTTTGQSASDGLWIGVSATGAASIVQEENSYIAFDTNATEKMRLMPTGELGIGTTTPVAALDIERDPGAATENSVRLMHLNNDSTARVLIRAGSAVGNGTLSLEAHSDNSTWAPGQNAAGDAREESGSTIFWSGTLGGGLNLASSADLKFYTGVGASNPTAGFHRMTIDPTGNVGIGTPSPTAKLQVNTSFRYVDGNQASGKVLTSGALGEASWQVLPSSVDPNAANTWNSGNQIINNSAAGQIGLTIKGFGGQTAPMLSIKDSANNPLYNFGPEYMSATRVDGTVNTANPVALFENLDSTNGERNGVEIRAGLTNGDYALLVSNQALNPLFVVKGDGKIGIGMGGPQVSLDMSMLTDAVNLPGGNTGQRPGTPNAGMIRYNTTNLKVEGYINGAWRDFVNSDATGHIMVIGGNASQPAIQLNDGDTGIFSSGPDVFAISTAGSERILIDPNGKIGIGNPTPTARVHLPPGTTSPNSAPIKFSAGPVMTTPEVGALEFDGTKVYFTFPGPQRMPLAVTAPGGEMLLPAGAVGTPALALNGDTDTGIYASGPNSVSFANGGVESLRIDDTGVTVREVLTVEGTFNAFWSDGSQDMPFPMVNINNDDFTPGEGHGLKIQAGNDNTDKTLEVKSRSNAPLLMVRADGRVGILNAGPSQAFQVGPDSPAGGAPYSMLNGLRISGGEFGPTDNTIWQPTAGKNINITVADATNGYWVGLGAQGNPGLVVTGVGRVGIGTTAPNEHLVISGTSNQHVVVDSTDGSGSSYRVKFAGADKLALAANSTDSYLDAFGAARLHLRSNGFAHQFVLNTDGKIGIGIGIPQAALDVSAHTDAIALPSGTIGQRPGTPANGMIRYSTSSSKLEGYVNASWQEFATGPQPWTPSGTDVVFASSSNPDVVLNSTDGTGAAIRIQYTGTDKLTMTANSTSSFIDAGAGSELVIRANAGSPVNQLSLQPNGNVGVGVQPLERFHIKSTTGLPSRLRLDTTDGGGAGSVTEAEFFANNAKQWGIVSDPASGFKIVDSASTPKFEMSNAGRVGIGSPPDGTAMLKVGGVVIPSTDNAHTLGTAPFRWMTVYAANGTINTSDGRLKKDVELSSLGLDFVNDLRPVSYRWNSGSDQTLHFGVIAQETAETLRKTVGAPTAIVDHDKESDRFGVRYSELIAPLIKAVQELYAKFMDNDREIASLKEENALMRIYLCSKDPSAPFCK